MEHAEVAEEPGAAEPADESAAPRMPRPESRRRAVPETWPTVVGGLLVTAAGLTVGALVAAAQGVRSPVHAVGTAVVDDAPRVVREWATSTLGTADKPALQAGVVVLSALAGILAVHLARRRRRAGFGVVAAFGLVGMLAADTAIDGTVAWAPSLIGAVASAVALALLVPAGRLRFDDEARVPPGFDRRRFLERALAVGVGATAASGAATWLERSRSADVAEAAELLDLPAPEGGAAVVPSGASVGRGVAPFVTPNDRFYRIDTALVVPRVGLDGWRLRIDGLVDQEVELTFEEFLDLGVVERVVTLCCVSNQVGGDLVGNARWLGVPLPRVLELAGVQRGATQLASESADGWTCGFPTELALDGRDAMVAVGMNGEPLPPEHGFPARLVVPGLYGYVSATKWLTRIRLTTLEGFDGYWIPRGWAKDAPVKTQSRIDVPRPSATLSEGRGVIAGVAWAQHKGIDRVEVQVDEGDWREAHLGDEASVDAWRQWWIEWDATPGTHRLRVRATDGDGEVQTERRAAPAPDGATGWHTIEVEVD